MKFNESKYNAHWQNKTLNDLGKFKRGKSKHRPRNDDVLFLNGKYPLVQTGDIKAANLYIRSHSKEYNEFGLSQSKLWKENTLCITIAANIAETALLSYPMCFPDSVVGFNAFPDESSEIFMHYFFTFIKKSIQNSASGSTQDNININFLTELNFKIPNKDYQDKITCILSVLDQKIEINNRINQELEAMAKTIYDYWFVQFDFPNENGKPYRSSGGEMVWNEAVKREIPKGWELGTASDLISFNPKLHIKQSSPASYIDMNAIPTQGFMTKRVKKKKYNGGVKFQNGDVIIARITPCLENGKTGLITLLEDSEIGFGSTEFIVLRGKESSLSSFICCLSRSKLFRKYAIANMIGTSGRKRVDCKALEVFPMVIPNKNILEKFESTIGSFFEITSVNTR